ncbi:MAG: hypothetical protein HYZ28_02980 [Myxococcales bacterium]|nr:hypothetical protein [Myxococcales bacterium]
MVQSLPTIRLAGRIDENTPLVVPRDGFCLDMTEVRGISSRGIGRLVKLLTSASGAPVEIRGLPDPLVPLIPRVTQLGEAFRGARVHSMMLHADCPTCGHSLARECSPLGPTPACGSCEECGSPMRCGVSPEIFEAFARWYRQDPIPPPPGGAKG